MRQQFGLGRPRRLIMLGALFGALALVALAGAVKVGHAASTNPVTSTFTVLNDVSATVPGQPTPGGNIGYEIQAQNSGTQNVNHVNLSETIGTKGSIVFLSATGIPCSGLGTSTLSCSMPKLLPGTGFDVVVLFRTDGSAAPGSNVTNNVVCSFDPQTPNTNNNRQTDTCGPTDPVVRQYVGAADGSLAESLSVKKDGLTAGGSQTSTVTMPPAFLNGFNYVGTRLENSSGTNAPAPAGCANCLAFKTKVTMPNASVFGTSGPFLDGTDQTSAYTWSIKVPVPNSFKPLGVWHSESDDGSGGGYLPSCAVDLNGNAIAPTAAPGLCVSAITPSKPKGFVTYSGLGVNNGSSWAG